MEKTVSPWVKLVKEFTGPMPIMIWLAILVEAIIKDVPDLLILLFLQLLISSDNIARFLSRLFCHQYGIGWQIIVGKSIQKSAAECFVS